MKQKFNGRALERVLRNQKPEVRASRLEYFAVDFGSNVLGNTLLSVKLHPNGDVSSVIVHDLARRSPANE